MSTLHFDPAGRGASGYPVAVIGDPDAPIIGSGSPNTIQCVVGDRFVLAWAAGAAYVIDLGLRTGQVLDTAEHPVIHRKPR